MRRNSRLLFVPLTIVILLIIGFSYKDIIRKEKSGPVEERNLTMTIEIDENSYAVTLEKNETTKALLARLPLEITMQDLNGNEKYYYFNETLPNNPSIKEKIEAGDIMLYNDDCLVLFYETFKTNYQYTRIGKIEDFASLKNSLGNGNIKILLKK